MISKLALLSVIFRVTAVKGLNLKSVSFRKAKKKLKQYLRLFHLVGF